MVGKKRVTIGQVAREAGVSTQTVSRVINDRPDVAPETRQRVKHVIDRLEYQPSNLARSLIQGRSSTLGVVSFGLDYFGPSRVLSGIQEAANEFGYSLLLNLVNQLEGEDEVKRVLQEMLSRHVDGIVWAVPSIGNNRDWIEQDTSHIPVPIVFISMQSHPKLSVIAVDNRRGGRMATKHLLDQGHQVIGLITGPLDWWEARQRHLGWRDALAEAGIVADDDFIVEGDWRAASGEQGLRQLLEPLPDISAIFACNDQMALGALLAARGMGRRVPEDLAVVGFDDISEAAYFHPPLSTVRQDLVELGYCAVRELRRRIEPSQQVGGAVHPKTILLQPELVIRTSSDQGEGR